ncbi:MAG TPA: cysteine dioxygenase [Verrucomicrobiae bacterium]|jgi:predicted metal-dependent enzyme (double-stranded beta helix superfamily)|nr:cysteine dioxygenase [Verrucomicrobiae bacterium]
MASIQPTMTVSPRLDRLRDFVIAMSHLVESASGEPEILREGSRLLKQLIATDDWLPARYAEPSATGYRQYLLHADSRERFSVVSFVWGPGQKSPIHDHTIWGIVGVLRGAEYEQSYALASDGRFVEEGAPERLEQGEVTAVSPSIGDFHRVSNAFEDRPSLSIHVYGANIGAVRRSVYQLDGTHKTFISGYSNSELPNLWDRSKGQPGA